jgi:hypothetical protein
MELIHKQGSFVTTEKHLEKLYNLKKCMENYIHGSYKISKKLFTKKQIERDPESKKEDLIVLDRILKSIDYYKSLE